MCYQLIDPHNFSLMAKETGKTTLDPDMPQNVQGDILNDAVAQYLEVISENYLLKQKQDTINESIQDLFESGFIVTNPEGTRKLESQRLYQALWRTASRMKPLDFMIHGSGRPRNIENVVTDGVWTIMDRGGYDSALRDKGGAFFNLLLYGDGFIQVGTSPDGNKDTPIVFNSITGKNLYTDNYATGIRTKGWGRNATKVVAIFSYSWSEFVSMYPKFKDKVSVGLIPRTEGMKDLSLTEEQDKIREKEIEVAYGYDVNNKNYTIFAGSTCVIIEQFDGDDYPFVINGSAYIPVSQFICMPSSEGFWNHGVGAMLYKLAIVSRQLMNLEVHHVEDNTLPIELVSVPQGEAANFFNKLKTAHKMRAAGKKGYVPMERDPSDPNGSTVSSQTLTTQNLFNEWQAVFDRLDKEIRRLGINIDELETTSGTTATEILALEENSSSFVKQVMEYNASESQFLVELTLDFIGQFIGKKNKGQLNLTTSIDLGGGQTVRADGFTLGMLAQEVKDNNYFVKVNARTGAIPSRALERAQLSGMLGLAAPGSPAHIKITEQLARLSDVDIPGSEFAVQQPSGPAPEVAPQTPTGTDRLTVSAQQKQVAAL